MEKTNARINDQPFILEPSGGKKQNPSDVANDKTKGNNQSRVESYPHHHRQNNQRLFSENSSNFQNRDTKNLKLQTTDLCFESNEDITDTRNERGSMYQSVVVCTIAQKEGSRV